MYEIVKAGGIMMVPIILSSIIAIAIIVERLWTLQRDRVLPRELFEKVWQWVESNQLQDKHVQALQQNSPLGKVLAAGLANRHRPREVMREAIEDSGRHVVHELERFLSALGTIAGIAPLLGLLGTVFGMIRTFNSITTSGIGNPATLASGIAEALVATAAGLTVAIPSLICFRMLRRRVDGLVIEMEKEAIKLVQAVENASSNDLAGREAGGQANGRR
ncbi:MAG: MotA/TolQ/ExbB proton channel family protein [Steroidobacteraceae bacterium]